MCYSIRFRTRYEDMSNCLMYQKIPKPKHQDSAGLRQTKVFPPKKLPVSCVGPDTFWGDRIKSTNNATCTSTTSTTTIAEKNNKVRYPTKKNQRRIIIESMMDIAIKEISINSRKLPLLALFPQRFTFLHSFWVKKTHGDVSEKTCG